MGNEPGQEERRHAHCRRQQPAAEMGLRQQHERQHDGDEVQPQHGLPSDQRLLAEHDDECEQIKRERDHPDQRRGGDVGGDVVGVGREQA